MNYYEARQRESDKRWDFTVMRDKYIRPVGYCHEYVPATVGIGFHSQAMVDEFNESKRPFMHKYHTDGHATQREAEECYRQYCLDQRLKYYTNVDEKHKCQVCGEWTQKQAVIEYESWWLCDSHANRDIVSTVYHPSTVVISST